MNSGLRQFSYGTLVGVGLTGLALYGQDRISSSSINSVSSWLQINLGYSLWLFAAVALIFLFTLIRLRGLLNSNTDEAEEMPKISSLDQMLDVWTQVFIGIGVVWTAVGMRAALQYALGEPDMALADSADNMLRKLVDGGILLALTTTIVGAVGGYLMRLSKTITLGSTLQHYYDQLERRDIVELVAATQRIEKQLQPDKPANPNVTRMPGAQV